MENKIDNSNGPALYKRDSHGLFENVQYVFNDDGSVNWRAMIKEEHLYVNKDYFARFDKEVPTSIEGLNDNQLLIKLGGIKELAKLRGYKSCDFYVTESSEERAVVSCRIKFIGNYETGGEDIDFEDLANATLYNTDGFSAKFLECIAANRAFIRCVRNFLNIHIVGADEIDKSGGGELERDDESSTKSSTPQGVLEKTAAENGYSSFDDFKSFLRELWKSESYMNDSVKEWEGFSDIPTKEARTLLALLKKK